MAESGKKETTCRHATRPRCSDLTKGQNKNQENSTVISLWFSKSGVILFEFITFHSDELVSLLGKINKWDFPSSLRTKGRLSSF